MATKPKKSKKPAKIANNIQQFETMPMKVFAEKAYLDYSMYVILDRALPHIADGLKPVQRRIVYAMSELGLKNTAKYKKSARTVGDVLGKYHPHGDSACYEAMVLMAQDFSYRYPLIDGQGNWGSPDDPKSFAAMRYTESRLTAYAQVLLNELEQGTVSWSPNFDGSLEEPSLLPSRLPNILLNGSSGIAVGMATDIPPHNLKEVVSACIHLIDNPQATLKDLCKLVKGPDFPTEGEIITPAKEIAHMYQTGQGAIRQRATFTLENGDIVITALPHQTSGAKVLEQIAEQMLAKKLPMVEDLRDESDHENPIRLIITPKSNRVDVDSLMAHLFATTDLERSYRINLNMIGTDGKPKVKNLHAILSEWLEFRVDTVRKRLEFRLDKVLHRLHILDGLMIAYLNIDEVIAIIRKEDEPKPVLMKRYKLSEIQAEAILDLKLRHLAKLEEIQIRKEQKELSDERDKLQKTLGSNQKLRQLVRKELSEDAEKFGDPRRSPIVARAEAQAMREEDRVPNEAVTVVLSDKGWIRAAKGHDIDSTQLSYRAGDQFKAEAKGRSNQSVLLLDSTGRSYALPAHTLPSARGQGDPLTSKLKPADEASFVGVLMGDNEQLCLLASDAGYGFVTKLEELYTKNRSGKAILKLPQGSLALPPKMVTNYDEQYLAIVSKQGHLLIFPLAYLPQLPKGKGNKMVQIPTSLLTKREDYVVDIAILNESDSLILHSGKRSLTLKPSDLAYYQGERGRRGNLLPRGFRQVDCLSILL